MTGKKQKKPLSNEAIDLMNNGVARDPAEKDAGGARSSSSHKDEIDIMSFRFKSRPGS
jgi:hypothetical protein